MVTTFYPPYHFGGDALGVQRLARAFARRGHAVTVVHDRDAFATLHQGTPPGPGNPGDGVRVETLRSRFPMVSSLLTHQLGRPVVHGARLRRLLAPGTLDVIFFHNVSLVGGPGVLALGDALKIYVAHEHWLVCPTHVLWRHGREPCPARECVRCQLRARRPPQLWRGTGLLERAGKAVDAFVALSEFSRDLHGRFAFPFGMDVIPGFLPDDGSPGPAGTPPHPRPYVLCAGRLERMKGFHDVIPLFAGGDGPDLLIAGTGPEGDALRSMAADAPRIRMLGRLAPEDLRRHYGHALAVVVPSLGYETFGYVIIEAMREGTPVIARHIGPFPELLAHGGGMLFSTRDELRAALETLWQNAVRRAALGREARACFAARWTEDAVFPRYLDLIAALGARRLSRTAAAGRAPAS